MNIFFEEHQQVIRSLIKHDVRFLLIGGYAVMFHGYRRSTGDMDLWLEPTNENKKQFLLVLQDLGIEDEDIEVLKEIDFSKHQVFSFGEEPQKIDFITYINQVAFEEAYANKTVADFENLLLPVLNLRELILSKMNTGRKKDESDVEELQRLLKK
ncbi:MAG: hypothetical protein RLZZ292_1787 [Bacteroidota bacterium]